MPYLYSGEMTATRSGIDNNFNRSQKQQQQQKKKGSLIHICEQRVQGNGWSIALNDS